MAIINKQIEPSVADMLLSLELKTQCLVLSEHRKGYLRTQISKVQKENLGIKFKTKVENSHIYAWRVS